MSKTSDFIIDHTKRCSNEIESGGWNNRELSSVYQPWITPDDAMRAVEIAKEEAEEHFKEKYKEIFNEYWTKGFEDGRDDMYDELMKNAISGDCMSNCAACFSIIKFHAGILFLQNTKLKAGDKVKVIIIKED